MAVERGEEIGVAIGGAKEEAIVDKALLPCPVALVLKRLQGCCLWHRIGHV